MGGRRGPDGPQRVDLAGDMDDPTSVAALDGNKSSL